MVPLLSSVQFISQSSFKVFSVVQPSNAGLILTPMMIGSVIGSQTGGQLASRTSYRNIMMASGVFFVLGIYLLSTLTMDTPRLLVTLFMVLAGLGVGFSFSVLSMSSIHKLEMRDRGSATSTNSFFPFTRYDSWCNNFRYNSKSYFYR